MLKGIKHNDNFQLLKCAADLWLPAIRRNGSDLPMLKSQPTPTFLIIESTVDFIKRKCVQSRALTKCRKQIPRLVAASFGRYQKQYTSPKAPTQTAVKPLDKPDSE